MQTSQVSNPANLLAAGKTGAKASRPNGDSGDGGNSFDQALSREVAGRDAGDAAASQAAGAQQTAGTKPAESRTGKSGETEDGATQETAAPADAQSQFSADMLALVAAINSITAPAAQAATGAGEAPAGPVVETDAGRGTAALLAGIEPRGAVQDAMSGQGQGQSVRDALTGDAPQSKADAALVAATGQAAERVESAPEFIASLQESTAAVSATPAAPQLALQAIQHHPAAAADKLTPAVGTPAWDQALGQKVVWMVAGDQQSASLTLNPPDLGPLQVVLNVSNSQASATFTAAQPEVRQALEAALPRLREMLGEAGIQLGQASVNSGQPNQTGDDRRQASHGRGGNGAADSGEDAQVRVSRVQPAASGLGLVDTFA